MSRTGKLKRALKRSKRGLRSVRKHILDEWRASQKDRRL